MMLLNTYDLGNYIQHFHHLQKTGQLPEECHMFLIRQFFADEKCEQLGMTMISIGGHNTGTPIRVFIMNDELWTTVVLNNYTDITEAEKKLHGKWMRVWDHTRRSMTDLTRVWSLLSYGQFDGRVIAEPPPGLDVGVYT